VSASAQEGAHVDLSALYAEDARGRRRAVKKARVYVDTRAGATKEAGDICQPLKSGASRKSRSTAFSS